MSITQREFNHQCIKFVSKCQDFNDHWSLVSERSGQVQQLIVDAINVDDLDEVRLMLMKSDIRILPSSNQVLTYEFNVIYSESYEVPVMYFCTSHQDGSPISLENILTSSIEICKKDLGQVVSQVEHPLLFRPFHMIHPCRTKDFMESHIKVSPGDYLVCWLSTVGTFIGLKLDFRLASV